MELITKKEILVISDCPTHPTDAGNRSCQLSYCDLLRELGYDVYFLYISKNKNDIAVTAMQEYWGQKLFVYTTPCTQSIIQRIISKICRRYRLNYFSMDVFCPWFISRFVGKIVDDHKIDSIIINYVWLSRIFNEVNVKNKVIFTHDVFSHKRFKGCSQWFSFNPSQESKALMRCDKILAIQEKEAIYYQYLAPLSQVYTVYSPYKFHRQQTTGTMNLLFFSGRNEHNLNGIRCFLEIVFPKIKSEYPEVKLIIGGGICKVLRHDCLDESVILKGFYDNPADFYQQGDIVINPIFEGTGLKIKTFEAISYGKIVLAHPHSFEGVFEKDVVPMFCCHDVEDYLIHLRKIENGAISRDVVQQRCEGYINLLNEEIKKQYQKSLA